MRPYIDNQAVQRSPKMMKSFLAQQNQQIINKSPQKSEINHFIKKNTVIPSQQQISKINIGGQLSQVESQQSIKTSPVKNDSMGQKQYPQSIQKAQTHKTQKIKIGMHKKAVSLMGSSHTSQLSNFQHGEHNFLEYTKQSMNMMNANSQKQSHVPSSQTSFNDYSSANNINYADIKNFPKVDNFIINDKTGSLLTAQQQQQVKQFQKILLEQQYQQQQTFDHSDQREGSLMMASGLKSFDQRPPIGQNHVLSNTQSQRMSIVSDSGQQQNLGYRSQANSFKAVNQNIAMKHPPNKYIKGNTTESQSNLNYNQPITNQTAATVQASSLKSKKSLQYSHQRTFSDNPTFLNNNKNPLFNPNLTGQATNRNFQELIRSVNSKDQFSENFMNHIGLSPALTQDMYPIGISGNNSTINQNNVMVGPQFAGKTTIASSRQSAQSQVLLDERDIINQHYQGQMSAQEMNQLYQAQLKEQFLKTKQALKMTQQQFGGPSRKVVQGNRLNGSANTQSYRINNQQTLAGSSISKMTFQAVEQKQTPKIMEKTSGKSSANQSYNVSAHGTRTTNNQTSLNSGQFSQNQQILYSDKIKKQKPLKQKTTIDTNNIGGVTTLTNLNFIQAPSEITIQKQGVQKNQSKSITHGAGHKRSISDGNQIFQSLSGRGQLNQQQINQYAQVMKNQAQNQNMIQNINLPQNSIDMMKQNYQKQHSLSKIPSGQTSYGIQQRQIMNEYPITSDRGPYAQSQGNGVQNPSILINSHRKIGALDQPKHIRHNSDQVTLDSEKIVAFKQPSVLANTGKSMVTNASNKIGIKTQKSQKEILIGNEMIIQDQGINQISQSIVNKKNNNNIQLDIQSLNKISPMIAKDEKNSTFYNKGNNSSITLLKPVEERIETQESAASDPSLTPRSRMNFKINKKIKLAFSKTTQNPTFTTQTDFYKIGKVMGKGAFGKVNLAIHRLSNKFVALKSINKQFLSEEASKRKVMQEFNILRRTRHISIVRLYESFETAQHIVFVMEVCGSGDLLTYVRRRRKLKEDVAKHMFKQIIEGLRYCHSKNILHRDIKLDNILLNSEGDIKICDFGVSKLVKNGEIMTEQCGTPAYIAPEVFENKGYEGYASDIWSAGVVLYAMLYGTVPFKANNMTELQKQITKCQTTFKDEISPEAISLLKGILERDPQKRLKISEIFKHPWMLDIPEKVSVFTEQEKEKVIQEFAYYNFKNDPSGNDNGEIVHTDPFTEQMLNSTQNSLVKNASTKSVILAPFNSTRSHIDDDFHNRKSIQDLLIDKKNIKFAAKVKEIDRQYEANNNAELDNGVYHQDTEEDKKEEEEKKAKNKDGSIETSFDKDDQNGDGNNPEGKKKKQSEWQKLEKMVIDRQKTEEEEDEKEDEKNANLGSAQTIVLEDRLINEIERHGFPRSYIVNSLNNDELNYVTTCYYLLTTVKEY